MSVKFDLSDFVNAKHLDIYINRHELSTSCEIKVNFGRIRKQFQDAQKELDIAVMNSMLPYMPLGTGTFQQVTRGMSTAIAGSGKVIAAAPPTGRFLYYGKVMVDPETGSPWARQGAKKVVTARPLTYSNPKATPEWFETAKDKHGKEWVKMVKKTAGGG